MQASRRRGKAEPFALPLLEGGWAASRRSKAQLQSAGEGGVRRVAARGQGETSLRTDRRVLPVRRKLFAHRFPGRARGHIRVRRAMAADACGSREGGLVRRPFCGVRSRHRQTFGFGRPGDQANESNCNQAKSFHVQRSLLRPHGPAKPILTKRAPLRKLK